MSQLSCGCCGKRFPKNQDKEPGDHDKGFGMCPECYEEIRKEEYKQPLEAFRASLREDRRILWDTYDFDLQVALFNKAVEEIPEAFSWTIKGA